ncbi:hypothetical protein WAI453_013339 [Rhynchosporium graminicola]
MNSTNDELSALCGTRPGWASDLAQKSPARIATATCRGFGPAVSGTLALAVALALALAAVELGRGSGWAYWRLHV